MKKALIYIALIAPVFMTFAPPAQAANFPQAVKAYKAKNYPKALCELKECYKKYPNNTLVRYYLALTHQQMGHVGQAKAHYKWVVDNGDQTFKARAEQGYNQLAGLRAASNSAPARTSQAQTPTQSAGGGAPDVKKEKVKKILEFYADW